MPSLPNGLPRCARLARAIVLAGLTAGACLNVLAQARAPAPMAQQAAPAASAANSPAAERFTLQGTTFDGRKVSLAALRGKVVMLFFWSTDCAVCRDKLPELRANAQGWRGQPFELVLVNVDRRRADALAYEQAAAAVLPRDQRAISLWRGEAGYADSLAVLPKHLPLTLVIDRQGRTALRFEGRIPAEAWDSVAELMP